MSSSSPLRALSSRNYRLFFTGQLISLLGTWITATATLWLAYQLTLSPLFVGVYAFVSQAPSFLFGPIAGIWVDRVNRHRLLLATQALSMLQSFALAAFAFSGHIDIPHLLVLGGLQGVINAFDVPVRQALVVDFVENRDHLGNAIALNSSIFNLARLVGPALAGLLIAATGPAVCFLIDGISYLAVIATLLMMRLPPAAPRPPRGNPLEDLRAGVRYTWRHPIIRALILFVAAISFFGFSSSVIVPVLARDVFHGDARTLGYLMSAGGCGAISAALYLTTRAGIQGLGKVIVIGGGLLGGGLLGLGPASQVWVAAGCMYGVGLGGVLVAASSNTITQTLVENEMRGRVMSLFTMAFTGTMPLSNLLMGWLAQHVGSTTAVTIVGGAVLGTTLLFHLQRPRIRAAMARAEAPSAPEQVPTPLTG